MTSKHTSIRAGWVSYVRAHGLSLAHHEPRQFIGHLQSTTNLRVDDIRLVTRKDLGFPASLFPSLHWYAVEGQEEPPPPHYLAPLRSDDPPGSWIQLIVCRNYAVASDLFDQFVASKGETVRDIDAVLGDAVERDLREIGIIASAIAAASLPDAQPALRGTGRAYWRSDSEYAQVATVPVSLTIVPVTQLDDRAVTELLRIMTPFLVERTNGTQQHEHALALAAYWLLTVCALPNGSNERFLVQFQIIEALGYLADTRPDQELVESFRNLRKLVLQHAGSKSDQLVHVLKRCKERMLVPSLGDRFAHLARRVSPNTADTDIQAFDEMNRLRNQLVHARLTVVPRCWKGYDVEETMRCLTTTYFATLCRTEGVSYQVDASVQCLGEQASGSYENAG